MKNQGFEFNLGYRNKTAFGLTYDLNGNISTYRNEILELPETVAANGKFGGNGVKSVVGHTYNSQVGYIADGIFKSQEEVDNHATQEGVELLTVNEYSRPGTELAQVNGIVVHYTANPGTTAEQNRSYFESLAETGETHASSHFIIGISGEIIQCIPCNEISYASNDRNSDTISVECCIPDESGKFTDETYQSLVELVAWLMGRYDLTTDDVIRHYDVTGKDCPKYFVENSNAWSDFKTDLLTYIDTYGIEKTQEIN